MASPLRGSQQERIKAQRKSDGSRYAARRQDKTCYIKRRAMFMQLRRNRYLEARSNPNEIGVSFFGRLAKVDRLHKYGLIDEVPPGGPKVQYEQRELLGFTPEDEAMIMDTFLEYVGE